MSEWLRAWRSPRMARRLWPSTRSRALGKSSKVTTPHSRPFHHQFLGGGRRRRRPAVLEISAFVFVPHNLITHYIPQRSRGWEWRLSGLWVMGYGSFYAVHRDYRGLDASDESVPEMMFVGLGN